MIYKNLLYTGMLFVVLPVWFGLLWVWYLKIEGTVRKLCNAWVLGLASMFASGQILLVPMILGKRTLTEAVTLWKIFLVIVSIVIMVILIRRCGILVTVENKLENKKKKAGAWKIIFGILAAALILLQAWIPYHYQHIDDDDARYVSEEVSAVVHDTLLVDDPITDEYMYWDVGEVRKDVTSPWTMYVAMCCKITGIAPAVFSHTFFPFFMIIICYVLYGMIGNVLFRGDAEKTALFLIVLSVFHIWNFTSTHTLSAMFLLRIWQGKAIVAGFILPLLMYLFYQIFMSEKQSMKWAAPLYALSFAAALLSGMGIIMAPVMMGLYGLLDGIYHRNLKRMLCIWIAALPCAVYMIYYTAGVLKGKRKDMAADFYSILDNFKNFIGGRTGLFHWCLFCLAVVMLFFLGRKYQEEKQTVRFLVWPTILVLLFLFNPLFYRYVGSRFFAGVYWRLFWMLPVSFTAAYVVVWLVCRWKKQAVRIVVLVAALGTIALSGQKIYSKATFTEAENEYKLPQAALDVADILAGAGVSWKVRSVVPNELLCYIRQYRCDIGLFYGRNVGGFISGIGDDEVAMYQQMCQEKPDMTVVTDIAKRNQVVFLCFNRTEQEIPDDMKPYGYHYYRETGDYVIYMLGEE